MPQQKHLNDFRGDACGLLVELFDFRDRLFLTRRLTFAPESPLRFSKHFSGNGEKSEFFCFLEI
jgi:hypothetical protein